MKQRKSKRNSALRFVTRIMSAVCAVLVIVLVALTYFKRQDIFPKGTDDQKNVLETGSDMTAENAVPKSIDIMGIAAGTVVDAAQVDTGRLSEYFVVNTISDDIFQYINGRSYVENDNISLEQLRYIKVLHYNYDHQVQAGEILVNASIAEDVRNIFQELFQQEYEIQSMYLIEQFWTGEGGASDKNSIENNNTSAFNYRTIAGTDELSNHALGCAIDLNPLQNPYVAYNSDGSLRETYKDMEKYMDRTSGEAHMITHEDVCYQIFTKYGFTWGGDWNGVKDYQHFEKIS